MDNGKNDCLFFCRFEINSFLCLESVNLRVDNSMPMECRPFMISTKSNQIFAIVYLGILIEIIFRISSGLNGFKI